MKALLFVVLVLSAPAFADSIFGGGGGGGSSDTFTTLTSTGTNPATAGTFRFANAESLAWRDSENTRNLTLTLDAGEQWVASGTNVGGDSVFSIRNLDNTNTASNSRFRVNVGGAGGGDPYVDYVIDGVTSWSTGLKNSDSDAFEISHGAPGTNVVLKATTAHAVQFPQLTATTVPYLDSNKAITSSAVTPTELGYLSGVTSALQTQLGLLAPLASPTFTGTTKGIDIGTTANGADGKTIFIGTGRISTGDSTAGAMQHAMASGGSFTILENGQQVATLSAQTANWGAFAASRDWTMQWQMGKGTSHYGMGRVRGYGSSTQTGNPADASEDDLLSKTVQASVLTVNDQELSIYAWGTTGATANTKTIKLYNGASAACTIATTANAKVWRIREYLARTGSSAEKYICDMVVDGTVTTSSGTLAINTAATMVVKITGQSSGSAASDVLNEALRVDYDRAGN